jgi:murein DD-endopeptidase MepM/ murein hydrolase activator NlpD
MAKKKFLWILFIIAATNMAGCQTSNLAVYSAPVATQTITPPEPVAIQQSASTPSPDPVILLTEEVQQNPIDSFLCGEVFCQEAYTGLLQRPFSQQDNRIIDLSYPYGSTKDGSMEAHHGVEFQNPFGTVVLAAEKGEVVFAGADDQTQLGLKLNYYGNVVVIHHPDLFEDQDVYTLYGHLSSIDVNEGEAVNAGTTIGKVGASGVANGPHLHFEVRVGTDSYNHTSNPVLWFPPLISDNGILTSTIAGVVFRQNNTPIFEADISLERLSVDGSVEKSFYIRTYHFSGINSHPKLGENFVMPDLPPGDYRLSFVNARLYEVFFTLAPGHLGFITLPID